MSDSERKPSVDGGRPSLLGKVNAQATTAGASGDTQPTRVLEQLGGQREQPSRFRRGPIAVALAALLAAAGATYWNKAAHAPGLVATKALGSPAPTSAPPPVVVKAPGENAPPVIAAKTESAEGAARVFVAEDAAPALANVPVAVLATPDKGTEHASKAAPTRNARVQPVHVASVDKAAPSGRSKHAEQVAASHKARPPRAEPARKSTRPDPDPDTDLIAAMLRRTDDARGSGVAGTQRSRPGP